MRRELYGLVLILSSTLSASAWWEEGHIIVARIAQGRLNPTAKAKIQEILAKGDKISMNDTFSFTSKETTSWADLIRPQTRNYPQYPKNDTWHYITIDEALKQSEFLPNPDANHVLGAIEKFEKVLVSPTATDKERKHALLFLIHFIGDMHQPLHCQERDDDKGGNLQPVRSFLGREKDNLGNKINLHKVWDGMILDNDRKTVLPEDYADRLANDITPEQVKTWTAGDWKAWTWDNHAAGVGMVYTFADGKPLPKRDEPAIELTEENYVKRATPVVRQQLQKAGVRLATFLNRAYPEKP